MCYHRAMSRPGLALAAAFCLGLGGCSSPSASPTTQPPRDPLRTSASAAPAVPAPDDAIARISAVHGGSGPWVVAGYRMGEYALARLGLARQSFDLEVIHHSPRAVQFSCMADGAAAATGASLGKLNLSLVVSDEAHTETVYQKKSTGQSLALRPTAAFASRFRDLPREKLAEAGRAVLDLKDEAIFEEVK